MTLLCLIAFDWMIDFYLGISFWSLWRHHWPRGSQEKGRGGEEEASQAWETEEWEKMSWMWHEGFPRRLHQAWRPHLPQGLHCPSNFSSKWEFFTEQISSDNKDCLWKVESWPYFVCFSHVWNAVNATDLQIMILQWCWVRLNISISFKYFPKNISA